MRFFSTMLSCALLLCASGAGAAPPAGRVLVSTLPDRVLIERAEFSQRLNFDLMVENTTDEKLELSSVEMSAYAPDGALVLQRRLGTNGDSIGTVPNREVEPGGRLVVFNPFHEVHPDLQLARIRFVMAFDAGEVEEKYRAETTFEPAVYETKTQLELPVPGRVLCWDGSDLYSHHRRLDITGGMTTALGIKTNFNRYSFDFSVVDEQGRMFKGNGERNEDWYGFGTPLYAPGDGVVLAASDGTPDNTTTKRVEMTREQVLKDVRVTFGNYVYIDHGNGEVSLLAHMKQGSVAVKTGDRVKRGQRVGAMGFSGDAITVHVHYQLQTSPPFGEGLPAHFRGVRRLVGATWVPSRTGFVDSGDVVQGRRAASR
jgi:murein DD-endopeptidase MepM/ murein hydrolase activator NlpD